MGVKGLTSNFSLLYPYIIQQTGNENTQTYQVVVILAVKRFKLTFTVQSISLKGHK